MPSPEPAELTTSAIEVIGNYAKVEGAFREVQPGMQAILQPSDRPQDGPTDKKKVSGVVTSVSPSYFVVRFASAHPQVGDIISVLVPSERPSEADNVNDNEPPQAADATSREKSAPRPKTRAAIRARREEERKARAAEEQKKWLARLEARGIKPWENSTEEQHAAALEKYTSMAAEVQTALPALQLYETEHFLFYSNMPPGQVAPYVRSLDRMYDMMLGMYGIEQDAEVWLGDKAPVFAFLTRDQFLSFEQKYFRHLPTDAQGLFHGNRAGDVVISCYRGEDPDFFGQVLVHETSHGFVFRYKTPVRLPTWINEGMADYIADKLVPSSDGVRLKEQSGRRQLKELGGPGTNFFDEDANLTSWQYGVASSMTRFLIEVAPQGPQRYRNLIELLKEGMPWEEALYQSYAATPQQLLSAYGQRIGLPAIRVLEF